MKIKMILKNGFILALLLALPITLTIIILAHIFGIQVRKIVDITKKRIVIVTVLLLMLTIFYILGQMRASVLEKEGANSIGTMAFIIFNYFFFSIRFNALCIKLCPISFIGCPCHLTI